MDGAGRGEAQGSERGSEETRTFLFLSRALTRAGWKESVCVGLGKNCPVRMRSDQEIPFPGTLGSLKLGGGVRV